MTQKDLVTNSSHTTNPLALVVLNTVMPVASKLCPEDSMKRPETSSLREKCPEPPPVFNQSCSIFISFIKQDST